MKKTTKTTIKLTKAEIKEAIDQYLERQGMIPSSVLKVTVSLSAHQCHVNTP
jgi:hypothetical protein